MEFYDYFDNKQWVQQVQQWIRDERMAIQMGLTDEKREQLEKRAEEEEADRSA